MPCVNTFSVLAPLAGSNDEASYCAPMTTYKLFSGVLAPMTLLFSLLPDVTLPCRHHPIPGANVNDMEQMLKFGIGAGYF